MEESGDEIILCEVLNNENKTSDIPVTYDCFFSKNIQDVVKAGKVMNDGLIRRQELLKAGKKLKEQVGAELCQAQVTVEVVVEIGSDFGVKIEACHY